MLKISLVAKELLHLQQWKLGTTEISKLKELSDAPIGRLLWKYSLPAVVGMLVMSLYNVIDRIFIGQWVGPDAIAGLAITFPVMNLSAAFGVLIGAGGSARISILFGSRDYKGASTVLGNALVILSVIICCYLTLFAIFIDDILIAFGASEVTLPYARDFMLYILPGMFMTNFSFTFNNFMRASGYPGACDGDNVYRGVVQSGACAVFHLLS